MKVYRFWIATLDELQTSPAIAEKERRRGQRLTIPLLHATKRRERGKDILDEKAPIQEQPPVGDSLLRPKVKVESD